MLNHKLILSLIWGMVLCYSFQLAHGQDTIYTRFNEKICANVTHVGLYSIGYLTPGDTIGKKFIRHSGYVKGGYFQSTENVIGKRYVDSVVYPGGHTKKMMGLYRSDNAKQNIPQLNTWTFDLAGFAFLGISMSYERRLKNGKVGFRIPVYVGWLGGGFAGAGTFKPGIGVYYPYQYYFSQSPRFGYSFASGLNVRYYPVTRRRVRPFLGPEVDLGASAIHSKPGLPAGGLGYDNVYYTSNELTYYGTLALLAKVGLVLNPTDRFNITFDGGAGVGDMWGAKPNPVAWTGLWHIGFSLGTNF